jgi:cytochrome P450
MSQQAAARADHEFLVPAHVGEAIVNPAAYGGKRPVEDSFKWLRRNNPVGWVEAPGFDPFWVVTKHADIQQIGRDNNLFHNGDRAVMLMDSQSVRRTIELTGSTRLQHNVLFMDNPEHQKYRMITQTWFMPRLVANRTEAIRKIARRTVQGMLGGTRECDFVADVALHYPLRVIMEILGLPEQDEGLILKLTQQLAGAQDPDKSRADSDVYSERFDNVLTDFKSYLRDVMLARRKNPTDDVASVIANGKVDGELISESDVLDYYIGLATAGHDTTSSSTAGAIWGLAANPTEFTKLKSDQSLIPSLVEEAIRWTTPVAHFMRSATADHELHSRKIAKGDWMMLSYLSGNQDEDLFPDAGFQVDRKPNPHISFGYGAHSCLGMHLARLEMRVLFEELLPHLDALELNGVPRRTESTCIGGPKVLPIRFSAH